MDKTRALQKIAEQIRESKKCPLSRTATKAVPGEGPVNACIMFIGAAPGRQEDLTGRPFVGRAGKYLTAALEDIGLDRTKVFITSAEKYFPPKNRPPDEEELAACRPFLLKQLAIIKPKIVVLLGKSAESIKPHLTAPHIIVTVHPSAAMRFAKMAVRMKKDFQQLKKLL